MLETSKSVLQEVLITSFNNNGNRLFIKRDDLIHKDVSGNKWRKLKFNVEQAKLMKKDGVLTFGGAYSNHLVATAVACSVLGLKSLGIVRGDELNANSNHTLRRCAEFGMDLHFLSRFKYDQKNEKSFIEELSYQYPNMLIVPEGGANYLGMIGCQEIWNEIEDEFDIVVVAQGTTTTSTGILLGLPAQTELWVVPVLKGFDSKREMADLLLKSGIEKQMIQDLIERVEVKDQFHFGGYGKYNDELLDFIDAFYKETSVPLDPIYTGKAMFALISELNRLELRNQKVLFIHTGGLQGATAIFEKEKRDIF